MRLKKCPDCKHKISKSAVNCPYCGRPMHPQEVIPPKETPESARGNCLLYFIIFIFVLIFSSAKSCGNSGDTGTATKAPARTASSTPVPTDTPIPTDTPAPPQPVAVEDSTVLPALKLFDNYEQYDGQYVTISAPVSYAYDDVVEVDDETAGKFYINLLQPRSDLTENDYITVTGLVDGASFGEVQLKNSNISATGSEPAQIFEQGKIDYANESGKIINEDALSEQDFKSRCKEMWYKDIVFSEDNLEGEYVKVRLYIEDSGVINPEKYYDARVEELIKNYHLDRTISMVGVYDDETGTYGSPNDIGILYSLNTGYTATDFPPGTYITLYGKIINYAVNKWDGHNSAYFMPKYIERN